MLLRAGSFATSALRDNVVKVGGLGGLGRRAGWGRLALRRRRAGEGGRSGEGAGERRGKGAGRRARGGSESQG